MSHEIVWAGREHALEDIAGFTVALGLQIGLAQHAIGIDVFGVDFKDVAAVG